MTLRLSSAFSIKIKFFLSHMTIAVLLLTSISMLLFGALRKNVRMNAEEFSSEFVTQTATILDYRAKDFENFAFSITNDMQLHNSLQGFDESFTQQQSIRTYDILDIVNRHTALNAFIQNFAIVTSSGAYLIFDALNGDFHYGKGRLSDYPDYDRIYRTILLNGEKAGWYPNTQNRQSVYFARLILDVNSFMTLGVFITNIDAGYFRMTTQNNSRFVHNAKIFVEDSTGELLFENVEGEALQEVYDSRAERISSLFVMDRKFHYFESNNIISGFETDVKKWRTISVFSVSNLMRYESITLFAVLITAGITLFLSAFLSYGLSSGITKNISELEKSMREIEKENFDIRITPHSLDEVGTLAVRFNMMADRINELVNTVYKERLEKQQLEFSALLAQINPHFLYNTLGSIRWLAHKNTQPQIEDMLARLIELLRHSVNGGEFTPLHEELQYIENYLTLQRYRFEDRFKMHFEILDETRDMSIPRFVLQPLIENALYHGIRLSKDGGIITLRTYLHNSEQLIVEVEDDGVGFSDPDILVPRPSGSARIGIKNIKDRLRLHFGDKAELSFIKPERCGTIARLKIPVKEFELKENA